MEGLNCGHVKKKKSSGFQEGVIAFIHIGKLLTPWSRVLLEKLTSKLCS
jgi:hypothetical protein